MNVFQNFNKLLLGVVVWVSIAASATENPRPICIKSLYLVEDCDLCGCTTGSGSTGFGTLNNSNFVGARYIYQNFESKSGIFSNSPKSEEQFSTFQLWTQVPVYKNFYITATVPYQDLRRKLIDGNEHINGLGDISVIGWYKLQFKKKKVKENSATFVDSTATPKMKVEVNDTIVPKSPHSVQFGLGVKLPTGEFEQALTDRVNPGFQVGTGSFDGIFSVGYNMALDRFGLNTLATYYVKGENKNQYRFGNQFSYSANAFYTFPGTKTNILPFLGISGDVYDLIEQYNETLANTHGNIINSSIGTEMVVNKFIVGASYTLPLSQNLFGGDVEAKNRFSIYVNYAL
ncbi:MAG: hypothetical protein R2786_09025 [Flavobacteriaceae bacterium]